MKTHSVSFSGNSREQRSLVGWSHWGYKESRHDWATGIKFLKYGQTLNKTIGSTFSSSWSTNFCSPSLFSTNLYFCHLETSFCRRERINSISYVIVVIGFSSSWTCVFTSCVSPHFASFLKWGQEGEDKTYFFLTF